MATLLARFWNCDSGATAIEYALIATFIGIAVISTVSAVGVSVQKPFQTVSGQLAK